MMLSPPRVMLLLALSLSGGSAVLTSDWLPFGPAAGDTTHFLTNPDLFTVPFPMKFGGEQYAPLTAI